MFYWVLVIKKGKWSYYCHSKKNKKKTKKRIHRVDSKCLLLVSSFRTQTNDSFRASVRMDKCWWSKDKDVLSWTMSWLSWATFLFVYSALTRKIILIKSTLKASLEQQGCTLNHPPSLPEPWPFYRVHPQSLVPMVPACLWLVFISQDYYNRS